MRAYFLIIFICSAFAGSLLSAMAVFLLRRPPPPSPTSTTGGQSNVDQSMTETVTLTDGSLYTLSKDDVYIANDFDAARGKGKMCNATTSSTSTGASRFKLTKDGSSWIVATDCDGDNKYTSYLSHGNDLIEAKDTDKNTQRWYIGCDASGCTFKNKAKATYLSGSSFVNPAWSDTPTTRYSLRPV